MNKAEQILLSVRNHTLTILNDCSVAQGIITLDGRSHAIYILDDGSELIDQGYYFDEVIRDPISS